ncbi:homeobox protein 2-like [Aplysia californica]|uniref:Homeobox protein 2-like n=1 Tax=Aplysia californica TaxID=6500 RepID=A0ABM1W4A9_APLCA|nr:homeobox protein 2-like [Aplysia californica]
MVLCDAVAVLSSMSVVEGGAEMVRCGSVYVTPSDHAHKVTQAVLSAPNVHEKKRRASKYTVAIGTTHGHVCTQSPRSGDNGSTVSEIYTSEPRVRMAGAAPSAHHHQNHAKTFGQHSAKKSQGSSRPAAFVPIPELGIYTPDQHVLQNGTYAQHCHSREVNNNKRNRHEHPTAGSDTNSLNNAASTVTSNGNSSFNSSFDESVKSYEYGGKGGLKRLDAWNGRGLHSNYPSSDVYHSCMDISTTQRDERDFGTMNSTRSYEPEYKTIREEDNSEVTDANRTMDPANRSHSLGDLTSGLAFSLVGQKKSESVASVGDPSGQRSSRDGEQNGSGKKSSEGSSALKHIRERLQRAVLNSQSRKTTPSNVNGKEKHEILSGNMGTTVLPSGRRDHTDSALNSRVETTFSAQCPSGVTQQNRCVSQSQQHYQQYQPQQQSGPPPSVRERVSLMQRQQSAPQPEPSASSPPLSLSRRRRDSEETTSSFKSALSDYASVKRPSNDRLAPSNLNNNSNYSNYGSSDRLNNNNNNNSSSSSNNQSSRSQSTLVNSYSSSTGYSTVVSQDTLRESYPDTQSAPNTSRTSSPSKPKRSLPHVPTSETSERIKRFTEMMKSRITGQGGSTGSAGSNSSSGSNGPQGGGFTPPIRMSSVDSGASDRSVVSRKSSAETPSDYEVSHINNNGGKPRRHERGPKHSDHSDSGGTKHQLQSQMHKIPETVVSNDVFYPQNSKEVEPFSHGNGFGPAHVSSPKVVNGGADKRRFSDNGPGFHESTRGNLSSNFSNGPYAKTHPYGYSIQGDTHDAYVPAQASHVTSEETPLPPGDRSTDSGQTTGTNHSYNGSALDSGYTTNNDGENDSVNLDHQRPPPRHQSNLANSHRFGSVQNVSSAQAHGNPRDGNLFRHNPYLQDDRFPNSKPAPVDHHRPDVGPYSAREYPNKYNNNSADHGSGVPPVSIKSELLPVTRQLSQSNDVNKYRSTNRRSWDYSDVGPDNSLVIENGMRRNNKFEHRYRSTEVMPSYQYSKDVSNFGAVHTSNQFYPRHEHEDRYPNSNNQHVANGNLSSNSNFRSVAADQRPQHASSSTSQSYNANLDRGDSAGNGVAFFQFPNNTPQRSDRTTALTNLPANQQSTSLKPIARGSEDQSPHSSNDQWNADMYRKQQSSQTPPSASSSTEGVRQRPVPLSRSNRQARGRTLPGGFRLNESDSSSGHVTNPNLEISLFHMTQKYDLCPLLLNLPKHVSLRELVNLKEVSLEISLSGVPGYPGSPQGQTPKIGSPGSAFTPVGSLPDQDQPLVAKVKVVCFSQVWDEVHKHTTLGRVLESDILVEVNGWFCLGADTTYLTRIVETCQGAITVTVARLKESDEKRYKGQTPAERIKGLETEISRLDNLIQHKDSKIKEMSSGSTSSFSGAGSSIQLTTSSSSTSSHGVKRRQTPVISSVNGEPPCEGMVIGDDEYVV